MRVRSASACALVLILQMAVPARAAPAEVQPSSSVEPTAATEFLIGNTVFVLAHEFGHAIIQDFSVPILGLEENSADTLAAGVLIFAERATAATSPEPGAFSRLLGMAAVGNVLTWRSGVELRSPELIYWAQHDLSARRAARILCLLVGSDEPRFGWLVGTGLVPEVRAENCPEEYALAEQAVAWVGRSYGQFQDLRPTDEGREVSIRYFDPATPAQAALLKRLRGWGVFEKVAEAFDRAFRFPAPLTIRLVTCGAPNAYWDPDARQLRFCYELLEAFNKLSVDSTVSKAYAALLEHEKMTVQNQKPPVTGVAP